MLAASASMVAMDETTYAVVQTIRVGRRNRLVVHARITGVPGHLSAEDVQEAVTEAGHAPVEAGLPWANHVVRAMNRLKSSEDAPRVATWTWEYLTGRPRVRQLNVRIPASLYVAAEAAAEQAGVSMRQWCEEALRERL